MNRRIPRPVLWIGGFLVAAGLAAFVAVWIGLAPIAASSGHWKITAWLLHFAMRQAVELRAGGHAPPESFDDPALVLRAAPHYATVCEPCHGAPGVERRLTARQMTPQPPFLPDSAGEWKPRELFWIVRHGVKFTAMPAWPAQGRADEAWTMAAFLRRLPEMTPAEYQGLAGTDEGCARCHGEDGRGRGQGAFPRLAGQSEAYLRESLRAYAAGTRHSGFMQPVAERLDAAAISRIAARYAAMDPGPASGVRSDVGEGARIASEGLPAKGVPACRQCHGPKDGPRAAIYPLLAGQDAGYLEMQLAAFRAGTRGGTPFAHVMQGIAERLPPEQAAAVAAYYASLAARP